MLFSVKWDDNPLGLLSPYFEAQFSSRNGVSAAKCPPSSRLVPPLCTSRFVHRAEPTGRKTCVAELSLRSWWEHIAGNLGTWDLFMTV